MRSARKQTENSPTNSLTHETASPRKSAVNRTDRHLCKLLIQKANSLRTPNPKPAAQVESVSSYEGSINDRYVGGAWRHIWELASASYLDRRHRVLWWRLLHCSLMCGAYKSYIGRATPAQANCPFSCCISSSQPQTISHLFLTCPVAATVTDWLCRLWQVMTGYLPVVSVAGLLAADTSWYAVDITLL